MLRFEDSEAYNRMLRDSQFHIANNEVTGACHLKTYEINDSDKNLFVFEMKIKTGYFGINTLTRPLYMLTDKLENSTDVSLLLDKALAASYNITYTSEGNISSVSLAVDENTSLGDKFTLYFSTDEKFEFKYYFQLLHFFLFTFLSFIENWYIKKDVQTNVQVANPLEEGYKMIFEDTSLPVFLHLLISMISNT